MNPKARTEGLPVQCYKSLPMGNHHIGGGRGLTPFFKCQVTLGRGNCDRSRRDVGDGLRIELRIPPWV